MRRGTKALRRFSEERKGILIGPPMAPRFPSPKKSLQFIYNQIEMSRLLFKSCGPDGKPTSRNSEMTLAFETRPPLPCQSGTLVETQ